MERVVGGCLLSVGMLAVVEKVVGGWRCGEGGWWWKCGWSKITTAKEKYYLKDHSPGDTNNSL